MLCRRRVSDAMRVMGSIGSRALPPHSALHILVQSPPTMQHLHHPPTSAIIYDLVLAFSLWVWWLTYDYNLPGYGKRNTIPSKLWNPQYAHLLPTCSVHLPRPRLAVEHQAAFRAASDSTLYHRVLEPRGWTGEPHGYPTSPHSSARCLASKIAKDMNRNKVCALKARLFSSKNFAERIHLVYSVNCLTLCRPIWSVLLKLLLVFLIVSVYIEYPCLVYFTVWPFDLVDAFYVMSIPMYLPPVSCFVVGLFVRLLPFESPDTPLCM